MRALSLTQPYASLVACGAKRVETRSWRTEYHGVIAIHAAKAFPGDCAILCERSPFVGALNRSWRALPLGAVIAVAALARIETTESMRPYLSDQELAFGDYSDGRWAWVLDDVQLLREPIPAKGALGLWRWTPDPDVLGPVWEAACSGGPLLRNYAMLTEPV